ATTITELQELLGTIKDELAKGKPVQDGKASPYAPSQSTLETFAPRTRARMLCSRLEDRELADSISKFLANIKNDEALWRTNRVEWLNDQKAFTDLANDLGAQLRTYKPQGFVSRALARFRK